MTETGHNPSAVPDPQAGVIDVVDASFSYDTRAGLPPAVNAVTLRLKPGRLTTLIGPNAAGKSTLMKLMLGLLSPTSGRVAIDSEPADKMAHASRARKVAYVPQRSGVVFAFTVREVVAMGGFSGKADPGRVDKALHDCGISDLAGRYVSQLSMGQQQMVMFARALVQLADTGRALLLDEPGSAMDLRHAQQIMLQQRRLADAGVAVLVVLHDLNLAGAYADDVLLMSHGKVVAADTWSNVMQPEILQPVYGVKLHNLAPPDSRPVFQISPGSH
jgi:iron complex transport system ATP-binding protein